MEPTIQQLRYFVTLAEHRHFGDAAAASFVSQPALSAQIKELERRLGITLFERRPRNVLITPAGEVALEHARAVLRAVDDLGEAVALAQGSLRGRLGFGVIPTLAPYLLPAIVPVLAATFPDAVPDLREVRTAGLVGEIAAGDLDLGLLALPVDTLDLHVEPLGSDPFLLAVAAAHPLAKGRAAVALGDVLAHERVLLLEDGHCLREHALAACSAARATTAEIQGTSLATLVQMVAARQGVTLLPASAATLEAREGNGIAVRRLREPVPGRELALVWRSTSPAAPLYRDFARLIRPLVRRL